MKSIITNDIITKLRDEIDSQEYSFGPFNFNEYNVIGIGAVGIVVSPTDHHLKLGDDVGHTYYKNWKEDVGYLLVKDLKKNNRSNIYEFKSSVYKAILRKIDESELEAFEEKGFNHIQIGDYNYTIIKLTAANANYSNISISIDESLQEKKEDEAEEVDTHVSVDEVAELESVSLFD